MKMKSSNILPLFKQRNDWYRSVKISLSELESLCDGCPYFYIIIGKNKYKTEDDDKPEMIFFIKSDKK